MCQIRSGDRALEPPAPRVVCEQSRADSIPTAIEDIDHVGWKSGQQPCPASTTPPVLEGIVQDQPPPIHRWTEEFGGFT
jgi:hypothetical protein